MPRTVALAPGDIAFGISLDDFNLVLSRSHARALGAHGRGVVDPQAKAPLTCLGCH